MHKFRQNDFSRVKILENYPESGKSVPEIKSPLIRELIEGNYRIIYRIISADQIDILTVYHSKRILKSKKIGI